MSATATGLVQANGIEICFETFGSPDDPTLLLVMGLGVQMIDWDPDFCEDFASHGFHVVRYDNRDVGRSTWFDQDPPVAGDGAPEHVPRYSLFDMAADGLGLLDALGIERAHVLGASMGGMIAQSIAILGQDRILSLCSIMSTTGNSKVGRASKELMSAMTLPEPTTRDEVLIAAVHLGRLVVGGGFPFDEAAARRRAAASFDRAFHPAGRLRQRDAIIAGGDRTADLRLLRVPAVVVHGANDPLVGLSGGQATAAAIPEAELVVIDGMGHEFPVGARGQIVDAFVRNARRSNV